MKITVASEGNTQIDQKLAVKRHNKAFALLCTWELYPILFIAAFLRLYRVDTVVFVDDNAVVFSMAVGEAAHALRGRGTPGGAVVGVCAAGARACGVGDARCGGGGDGVAGALCVAVLAG